MIKLRDILNEVLSNYKLYLDDIRFPKGEGWTIVRNVDDFKKTIEERGLPAEISFDHDLGEDVALDAISKGASKRFARKKLKKNVQSGYDAMKWLIHDKQFDLRNVKINVHSANPVGKANIEGLLNSWNKFLDQND